MFGFGVWGLWFGVWGVGCGVWGLGCGVWGLGFGFWVLGFGFFVSLVIYLELLPIMNIVNSSLFISLPIGI